jgi:hypothetical protein
MSFHFISSLNGWQTGLGWDGDRFGVGFTSNGGSFIGERILLIHSMVGYFFIHTSVGLMMGWFLFEVLSNPELSLF